MRVLVVGGVSWDTVVHLDRLPEPRPQAVFASRSYETLGSTGAGKALNLARLGHEVHLHTLLGEDEPGERAAAELRAAGVVLHIDRDAGPTERHVNLMASDGSRLSVYRSVAQPRPDLDLRPVAALAAECDAVVLNIADYVRGLIPLLDVPFWTDLHDWDGRNPHHQDFARAAYAVVLSDDALPDPGQVCRGLAGRDRLVVCTSGAAGAVAYPGAGPEIVVPAEPITAVVDTNGAGDAFTAGLLHGLYRGWPLAQALQAGAVVGALTVTSESLASHELSASALDVRIRGSAGPVLAVLVPTENTGTEGS